MGSVLEGVAVEVGVVQRGVVDKAVVERGVVVTVNTVGLCCVSVGVGEWGSNEAISLGTI